MFLNTSRKRQYSVTRKPVHFPKNRLNGMMRRMVRGCFKMKPITALPMGVVGDMMAYPMRAMMSVSIANVTAVRDPYSTWTVTTFSTRVMMIKMGKIGDDAKPVRATMPLNVKRMSTERDTIVRLMAVRGKYSRRIGFKT